MSTRALPRNFQRRTRVDEQASSALLSFLFPQKAWLLPVHLRQAVLFVQPAVTVAPPHADWGTVQTGVCILTELGSGQRAKPNQPKGRKKDPGWWCALLCGVIWLMVQSVHAITRHWCSSGATEPRVYENLHSYIREQSTFQENSRSYTVCQDSILDMFTLR